MNSTIKATFFSLAIAASMVSCNEKDESEKFQERERAKIGKVYNPEKQGIKHENHNNQFPVSRNNPKVSNELVGGISDTTNVAEADTTSVSQEN